MGRFNLPIILVDPITTRKQEITREELMKLLECTTSYISKMISRQSYCDRIKSYVLYSNISNSEISKIISNHVINDEVWMNSTLLPEYIKVSNYGRVSRVYANGKIRVYQGYLKNSDNSKIVIKCPDLNGVPKETIKARIIASVFLNNNEPINAKNRVIHKTGDKWDERVTNLKIVSISESGKIGQRASRSKVQIPVAKINPWTNLIVGVYPSLSEAGRQNGLSKETVRIGALEYPNAIYGRHTWKKLSKAEYEKIKEQLFIGMEAKIV